MRQVAAEVAQTCAEDARRHVWEPQDSRCNVIAQPAVRRQFPCNAQADPPELAILAGCAHVDNNMSYFDVEEAEDSNDQDQSRSFHNHVDHEIHFSQALADYLNSNRLEFRCNRENLLAFVVHQ